MFVALLRLIAKASRGSLMHFLRKSIDKHCVLAEGEKAIRIFNRKSTANPGSPHLPDLSIYQYLFFQSERLTLHGECRCCAKYLFEDVSRYFQANKYPFRSSECQRAINFQLKHIKHLLPMRLGFFTRHLKQAQKLGVAPGVWFPSVLHVYFKLEALTMQTYENANSCK